jgi:hypothetical protein
MSAGATVTAQLSFVEREALTRARAMGPRRVDYRTTVPGKPMPMQRVDCTIRDARPLSAELTLETAAFTLVRRPTAVRDWFDHAEVMRVYYEECRQLAREMTGASHAFTYDHLIREPGKQTAGGGLGTSGDVTGADRGGGYVTGVHMDYTDHATWRDYLALHGVKEPVGAARVVVLNFWRPLYDPVEGNPLAVCDGRTVRAEDLLETEIFGYGHEGYSWHNIGVAVYEVAASPAHRWYYYPRMTRDEVLLMKTHDSRGVVGRACPHASFANPDAAAGAPPRRSIELRVLCYVGAR